MNATTILTEEQQKNLEVAQRVNRETRNDPNSPYAGKHVGVLGGQVVAVADTLDEVSAQLDALGDVGHKGVIIEASADYAGPHMIWRSD